MRTACFKSSNNFVAFGNGFFDRPLDVREGAAHHAEDLQVAIETLKRGAAEGDVECGGGGDDFFADGGIAAVYKLREAG